GGDDAVLSPAGRMPDGVAYSEAVRARMQHLADCHDPVHRGLERKRGEVAGRAFATQAEAQSGVDGRPRVPHEHLARSGRTHLRLHDAEVRRAHLAVRVRHELYLASSHRRSGSTSRPIRRLFSSRRSTPTARVPMYTRVKPSPTISRNRSAQYAAGPAIANASINSSAPASSG